MDKLKKTTTIFFYQKNDEASLDSFKTAIRAAWDITPIEFDVIENMHKYTSRTGYSYFVIEGYEIEVQGSYYNKNKYKNCYLTLHIDSLYDGLCRIELFPDPASQKHKVNLDDFPAANNFFYNTAYFYNWSPIILHTHLKEISADLKNNIRRRFTDGAYDPELPKKLSNDTLFIPQRLMKHLFIGIVTQKEKLLKKYKFSYRVCTDSELYQIFQVEQRGRFLFDYVLSWKIKIVSVFDVKENKVIYRRYSKFNENLTKDDIRDIK